MSNQYPGNCQICGNRVAARAGNLLRVGREWKVRHIACDTNNAPSVSVTYFPSTGNTVYTNRGGRCEDAPCCGCCT